jgi:hypothetical protein
MRGFIGFKGINLQQQKIQKFLTAQQTQPVFSAPHFWPCFFSFDFSTPISRRLSLLERPALNSLPLMLSRPSSLCRINFLFFNHDTHSVESTSSSSAITLTLNIILSL